MQKYTLKYSKIREVKKNKNGRSLALITLLSPTSFTFADSINNVNTSINLIESNSETREVVEEFNILFDSNQYQEKVNIEGIESRSPITYQVLQEKIYRCIYWKKCIRGSRYDLKNPKFKKLKEGKL